MLSYKLHSVGTGHAFGTVFQHAEQMRQLAQEQNAAWDVQLCVDLTEPIFPTITFDSKIIAFLSTIEAKLDTDVYSVFDFDHV